MFGDKLNFGSLLKNAKKMQQLMEETQGELANIEVTGEAGAGAVTAVMTARHYIKSLTIDEEIYKEDKSIVEDLIIAAINDAASKVEKITQEKMLDASKLFGGTGSNNDSD